MISVLDELASSRGATQEQRQQVADFFSRRASKRATPCCSPLQPVPVQALQISLGRVIWVTGGGWWWVVGCLLLSTSQLSSMVIGLVQSSTEALLTVALVMLYATFILLGSPHSAQREKRPVLCHLPHPGTLID